MLRIRKFEEKDLPEMVEIWNHVVKEGNAFPQEEYLNEETGKEFFSSQSFSAVAEDEETGGIVGLYILHPNNIGRCGHISNASYAVKFGLRGRRIGEALVTDCIKRAGSLGFGVLQFNAVVATNKSARHLYEKLGFISLGTIKKGFRLDDGTYEDICPYYIEV
jgi:L-amino acid N-acyltransferase YncA